MANFVRADYDQLAEISGTFESESGQVARSVDTIRRVMETLEGGDWMGKGAQAFFREMHSEVLPALQRLVKALAFAAKATQQASQAMKEAEEESAGIFRRDPYAGDDVVDALRRAGGIAQAEVAGLGGAAQATASAAAGGAGSSGGGSGGGSGAGSEGGSGGGGSSGGGGGSWSGEIGFRQEKPGPEAGGRPRATGRRRR